MAHLFGHTYTRRELLDRVGDMSQVAHARKAELTEGNERGADLVEVFNASGLCFSVLPGRALDIASAHYKGMSLCYRSNAGDVGPAFYDPQGNGWLRGFFGGLVVTCGMTFVGHPETDPEEENEELGLHGRLSFLAAKNVATDAAWEGDDYVVRVRGKIREALVFGTDLELTREISTVLGEKSLRIYDRIHNHAPKRSPLMYVYHCNPGFPLLDTGTRFVIHSEKTTEWLEDREVGPERYTTATAPAAEPHDEVFVHRPRADADGNVRIALINDTLKLGLSWKFPKTEIPIVNQWQHFHRGTYVTGIEPGNVSVLGRAWNRKHGTLQYIEPDQTCTFHMEIGVLDGAEEIKNYKG
ncbi:MAG: aldose 1-epimerase family protein [candidate division Zixibacteria bacterium]|nr:aldose 1-epimerase family protein [candidate division Zixibacteria bacterium]